MAPREHFEIAFAAYKIDIESPLFIDNGDYFGFNLKSMAASPETVKEFDFDDMDEGTWALPSSTVPETGPGSVYRIPKIPRDPRWLIPRTYGPAASGGGAAEEPANDCIYAGAFYTTPIICKGRNDGVYAADPDSGLTQAPPDFATIFEDEVSEITEFAKNRREMPVPAAPFPGANTNVKIRIAGRKIATVKGALLFHSSVLREFLADYEEGDDPIPLTHVTLKVFRPIFRYLKHFAYATEGQMMPTILQPTKETRVYAHPEPYLSKFEYYFFDGMTIREMHNLIRTANMLGIEPLVDLLHFRYAKFMRELGGVKNIVRELRTYREHWQVPDEKKERFLCYLVDLMKTKEARDSGLSP